VCNLVKEARHRNLCGIIGGALAPIVATWLIQVRGVELVGLYMSAAAAMSLVGLWFTSRKSA
jgi:fucose permease